MKTINAPKKSLRERLREFTPLILVIASILVLTYATLSKNPEATRMDWMQYFMGYFFLLFGLFKLLDLKGFVMSYREYDIIAKQSKFYAYLYPFIELSLAALYLSGTALLYTNFATLILMVIGSIGVINVVWIKREQIRCACLGAVVKLPMTTVTVIEDLGMAAMAAAMIYLMV